MNRARNPHPERLRYCLYCLATISDTNPCPACGRTSRPLDRARYWTREPRLVAMERTLKAWLAVIGASLLFILGTGAFGVIPLLLALILSWPTASKITQHVSGFNAQLVWSLLLAGLALPPLNQWVGLSIRSVSAWFETTFTGNAVKVYRLEQPALLATSITLLAASTAAWFISEALARWRDRRIAHGK